MKNKTFKVSTLTPLQLRSMFPNIPKHKEVLLTVWYDKETDTISAHPRNEQDLPIHQYLSHELAVFQFCNIDFMVFKSFAEYRQFYLAGVFADYYETIMEKTQQYERR